MPLNFPYPDTLPKLIASYRSTNSADWSTPKNLLWAWNHNALQAEETGETYRALLQWIVEKIGARQAVNFAVMAAKHINPKGRDAVASYIMELSEQELEIMAAEKDQPAPKPAPPEPAIEVKSRWQHIKDSLSGR